METLRADFAIRRPGRPQSVAPLLIQLDAVAELSVGTAPARIARPAAESRLPTVATGPTAATAAAGAAAIQRRHRHASTAASAASRVSRGTVLRCRRRVPSGLLECPGRRRANGGVACETIRTDTTGLATRRSAQ